MNDNDSLLLEEALSKVYIKEALDPSRENRFVTFDAWKRAVKMAGAVRLDGDRDIATALNAEGKGVGEWDGEKGCLYNLNPAAPEVPTISPERSQRMQDRHSEYLRNRHSSTEEYGD